MTGSIVEGRALADTNILVYAHDPADPIKHATARDLLKRLSEAGRLVYSVQVFNEFCAVMLRPDRAPALVGVGIDVIVRELATTGEVVPLTMDVTLLALGAMPRHGFSFWDALIWAAAKENGVTIIYTEDFQHGREIEGVRFVNPFVTGG